MLRLSSRQVRKTLDLKDLSGLVDSTFAMSGLCGVLNLSIYFCVLMYASMNWRDFPADEQEIVHAL